jgi:hypothetical protein
MILLAALVATLACQEGGKTPFAFEADGKAEELRVLHEGRLLGAYRHASGLKKVCWFPVIGPSGKSITPEAPADHPHHTGFFVAAEINDQLFWQGTTRDRIRHVRFVRTEADASRATVETECVWETPAGEGFRAMIDDRRTVTFVPLGGGELFLDWTISLGAREDLVIRKTTHTGLPQCRVTPSMSVKNGGRITNSRGGIDEKGTHGKPAEWCDYSGPNGDGVEGVAMFSHPEFSPQHPPPWFTRDYGPMSPSPWLFSTDEAVRKIPRGGVLDLRWGILVHKGTADEGRVARRYALYVKKGTLERGD